MTLPLDLVLVRHGESEGNVAARASKQGDDSLFTKEFRARHSSSFRLSERGQREAETSGIWLRREFYPHNGFDRFLTSEYVRARETAGLLSLPDAIWRKDFYLRERNWGKLDVLPLSERAEMCGEGIKMKDTDPFYWTPTDGENIAELCMRIDRVLDTLHREHSDKRVLIVCHGEVMWAFRVRLERIFQERYNELDHSSDPHDRIHNGQILHYTRRDPFKANGQVSKYTNWVRSVCPSDLSLSCNQWTEIARKTYSSEELLSELR